MDPLFRLEDMLSDFESLFKHNNFKHFRSVVMGLINTPHRGTLTQVYESGTPSTRYWALAKFLSRGKWCVNKVTSVLTRHVQSVFSEGIYVYDETKSTSDGHRQYGTHFFRNTRLGLTHFLLKSP